LACFKKNYILERLFVTFLLNESNEAEKNSPMTQRVVYIFLIASIWLKACESDKRPLANAIQKPKQVGIQVFVGVDNDYVHAVKTALEKYYHFRVRILSNQS
jgi:hypothetical protein